MFYCGQTPLQTAAVLDGVASCSVTVPAYGESATYSAKIHENDSWAAGESNLVAVTVKSASLAVPTLTAQREGASVDLSQPLLAGASYTFYLGDVVTLDGGEAEYRIQWLRNGAVIEGAAGTSLQVTDALPGDRFCVQLLPEGSIRVGAKSAELVFEAAGRVALDLQIRSERHDAGYEGIVQGERVNVLLTPGEEIESLSLSIDGQTAQFASQNTALDIPWTASAPGPHTLTVTARSGERSSVITRLLTVRSTSYELYATKTETVYNGQAQGIEWALTGLEGAADQVTVQYFQDGRAVEPVEAGSYDYVLTLPEGTAWVGRSVRGHFTIQPRPVTIADLRPQDKVYDGSTSVAASEILLDNVLGGDSLCALGELYTAAASAGETTLHIGSVTLIGGDAGNYCYQDTGYSEPFCIRHNRLQGSIASRVYAYTGEGIQISDSDIYLIDQYGRRFSDYQLSYYYHTGHGLESVPALLEPGKYTVVARGGSNYTGGAAAAVYVGEEAELLSPVSTDFTSAVVILEDTVQCYGASSGVSSNGTVRYWAGGGWTETAPEEAGRYLVRAEKSGVVAYGIYHILKAAPSLTFTATDAVYNSAPYDGAPLGDFSGGDLV